MPDFSQSDGLSQLYRENCEGLVKYAYRLVGNFHDAEELADEAFVVYIQKQKEEEIAAPRAYLFKVISHLAANFLRSKRKEEAISLECLKEIASPDTITLPLAHYLPGGLENWEKEILIMRYEQRLPFSEIAAVLGLEEVSCRSRLFRAKQHCRLLEEQQKNF